MSCKNIGFFYIGGNRMAMLTPRLTVTNYLLKQWKPVCANILVNPGYWNVYKSEINNTRKLLLIKNSCIMNNKNFFDLLTKTPLPTLSSFSTAYRLKICDQIKGDYPFVMEVEPTKWKLKGSFNNGKRIISNTYENDFFLLESED